MRQLSVILSTYQSPVLLERTLHGYRRQALDGFEIVVADDGSGPETADVVRRLRAELGLDLVHVWHQDRGFRKCEILNRAIEEARGDYLVFSDGDCIPWSGFLSTHAALARRGRFLSGGYFQMSRELTERITVEDVALGRIEDSRWLHGRGLPSSWRVRRLRVGGAAAAWLDRLTPTRPSWNGHNSSGWKDDLLLVNGFDERMGYGGEDRELGERLEILGRRGLQIRHRAICLHQWHERGYVSTQDLRENRRIRRETARRRIARTPYGIAKSVGLGSTP
ncbi:MAG TPA: glycosyltransferase [Thermoanaerobaculia bacterium]|nr:glycosyltransferase [Thermoanaerobaculia bacterium]